MTTLAKEQPQAAPSASGDSIDITTPTFLSRDLGWLEFNRRVLHEALDDRTPLLERLRFLGIFTSNLDEFFMKRVGAIKRQATTSPSAEAREALRGIRQLLIPMLQQQGQIYRKVIVPRLAENGIRLLEWEELSDAQIRTAQKYFEASVFPILTPLAVDPGSPFPFISNMSTSLGVVLQHPDREEPLFARVKMPEVLPKWIPVDAPAGEHRFVSLHELIFHNLGLLFPDMMIVDIMMFRVTRNADIERDEEDADDLRELMEEELRQRRFAKVVRLEHGSKPNQWIRQFLMDELGLIEEDVYELPGELDYDDLRGVAELNVPKLRYDAWNAYPPPALMDEDADIFSVIRAGDLLVHHPYESFSGSVERFIKAAAADPKVLAIKMTLYRTGDESPFINTLVRAAESGKQVVCLVELKARFDEERNLLIAKKLEKVGVHIVYGIVGLKTHTKTTLVVREDSDGIRSYAHIGTGNYHAGTAKVYSDLGLLTCDPQITRDVVELFHYLTGRSLKRHYQKLVVAPINMRDKFMEMIEREVAHQRAGRPCGIIGKMNAMEERKICDALYGASQAGVKIDLIVRGFCTMRPGVAGLSDNLRVMSVIGRFLEHSRIYYFRNGAADPIDGEFFIGSADWMYRNLLGRVEAIVPIERKPLRQRLWHILQTMLNDKRQAWDMQSDGSYVQRKPTSDEDIGTQRTLMNLARAEAEKIGL